MFSVSTLTLDDNCYFSSIDIYKEGEITMYIKCGDKEIEPRRFNLYEESEVKYFLYDGIKTKLEFDNQEIKKQFVAFLKENYQVPDRPPGISPIILVAFLIDSTGKVQIKGIQQRSIDDYYSKHIFELLLSYKENFSVKEQADFSFTLHIFIIKFYRDILR